MSGAVLSISASWVRGGSPLQIGRRLVTTTRDCLQTKKTACAGAAGALFLCGLLVSISPLPAHAAKARHAAAIFAQRLVEDTRAAHPEMTGLEISTTPPRHTKCVTIASTEIVGIGEACDNDEFTAMRSGKPFVDREREGGALVYDITLPLHDIRGNIIAVAGIGLRPAPGQTQQAIVEHARRIARDLERKIGTKATLFQPAG